MRASHILSIAIFGLFVSLGGFTPLKVTPCPEEDPAACEEESSPEE